MATLRTVQHVGGDGIDPGAEPDLSRWDFGARLAASGLQPVERCAVTTLQMNLGRVCNQACIHCHVAAGPDRTESMTVDVANRAMELLAASPLVKTVDLTGGAPELNESFRPMVERAVALGRDVMDRCNLTVLFEPGMGDLPEFLASNRVRIVASMPCYTEENVDVQPGKGVFEKSIRALRALNAIGYGDDESGLELDVECHDVVTTQAEEVDDGHAVETTAPRVPAVCVPRLLCGVRSTTACRTFAGARGEDNVMTHHN